jgi:hypothetical protein
LIVYVNDGDGNFTELPGLSVEGLILCSLAWGDCDNDGDLDLAVSGDTTLSWPDDPVTRIYLNDGTGHLAEVPGLNLTGVKWSCLAWGDTDNDGDLDLVVMGSPGAQMYTSLYENNCPIPNTPPGAPTGLAATPSAGQALLTWLPASDNETPDAGLSYNLRVRNTSTSTTVMDGMTDPATGWRRIPAIGPVRPAPSTCSWTLKGLAPGDYEFQVQAIDSALAGGSWSAAHPFTVP